MNLKSSKSQSFGEDAPFYFDFWDIEPSWQLGFVCLGDFADAEVINIQLGNTQLFFSLQGNPYARSQL